MIKLPPNEKVIEAWTALADGRVKLNDGSAVVESSDGAKTYTVRFRDDLYSSDDNATYWRGYAGYPVIAVLMLQNRLPFDREEAMKWEGVNWKEVNTRFKNRYPEAVKSVAEERGIDLKTTYDDVDKVMDRLESLPIEIKRKI